MIIILILYVSYSAPKFLKGLEVEKKIFSVIPSCFFPFLSKEDRENEYFKKIYKWSTISQTISENNILKLKYELF